MHWLLSWLYSFGIATGPVMGYVYQCSLIKKRKSLGSFSINLCGMLLFCNILRIGFYFFKQYAFALLAQSIFMTAVQFYLLKLCVDTMNKEGAFDQQAKDNQIYDEEGMDLFNNFWKWPNYNNYLIVIGLFTTSVFLISFIFSNLQIGLVGEVIGFMSLISQSLLMMPQVVQNYRQQRVKGLSHLLVAGNNIGDYGKLIFFIINDQPIQFLICGIIQIFVDTFVIVQICYYGNGQKNQQGKEQAVEVEKRNQAVEDAHKESQHQMEPLPLPVGEPAAGYQQFQDVMET